MPGPLSTPELRTLIAKLFLPVKPSPAFIWAWSRWRIAHQIAAALAHRKKRQNMQL
jgi:hypothetical protein